jgi:CRP/FNR family cyclic AMP-dependent transcriptional regulator
MTITYRDLLEDPEFQQSVKPVIRSFQAGEEIVQEGTLSTEVFVMLQGKAEVYVAVDQLDKSGRRMGIARISEGEVIGELALFDHEPRTASVVAVTDCQVAAMDGSLLTDYMDRNPHQGYWILKEMFAQVVRRMRQTTLRSNTITALYLNDNAE